MKIGCKVFYDKQNGNVLITTSEMSGDVQPTTIEQDIATFTALSERNRDTFDVLELPFGAFEQDFAECNGYRVNVETKELEFSHPDQNVPTEPPVFQKPLSEQLREMESRVELTEEAIDFLLMGAM